MITEPINAVHSEDMTAYLASLGVLDDVVNGGKKCGICGKVVTVENISCLYPQHDQVKFICDDASCLEAIMTLGEKDHA